jgi:hypothetical protein
VAEELQGLILPIFCMHIGEWGLPLGERINSILQGNSSPAFKSALLYFLYSQIDAERHF